MRLVAVSVRCSCRPSRTLTIVRQLMGMHIGRWIVLASSVLAMGCTQVALVPEDGLTPSSAASTAPADGFRRARSEVKRRMGGTADIAHSGRTLQLRFPIMRRLAPLERRLDGHVSQSDHARRCAGWMHRRASRVAMRRISWIDQRTRLLAAASASAVFFRRGGDAIGLVANDRHHGKGEHHQRNMPVPAVPGAGLVVIKAKLDFRIESWPRIDSEFVPQRNRHVKACRRFRA